MAFDSTKPNPASSASVGQDLLDARTNDNALLDGSVLGIGTVPTTFITQNEDGSSPATDPAHPYRLLYTSKLNALDKWKSEASYDVNGWVTSVSHYRSFDGGASWVLIYTEAPTYDGAGYIIGWN